MSLDQLAAQQRPSGAKGGRSGGPQRRDTRRGRGKASRASPYSKERKLEEENARLKKALAALTSGQKHGGRGGNATQGSTSQRRLGATVLVAETSEVRKVAGAISGQTRDGKPPTVLATGPGSINQVLPVRHGFF